MFGKAGYVAAQNSLTPPAAGQDRLEARQMEAFQGLTEAIPYQNNLSGICVAERAAAGADRLTVNAARLPQGLYLLQVGLSGGRTAHTKVMR